MRDIRCLIVDDEPLAIDIVVNYLHSLDIHAITTANNAVEAFQWLRRDTVDLLFLDIRMPQLTGFDLLKSLPHRPLVVITTAYRDYAVEGFEWSVLDYLVKPFSLARFLQTMKKAARALETIPTPIPPAAALQQETGMIFLKTDRQLIRIPIESIRYIESLKDYIRVYTTTADYLCHQSLTEITARLPADKFYRVHRSYTLALDKINQIRHHCAHIGTATIPISRAHRGDLYRRLGK
jgi:two-component system LytT family response regulator